MSYLSLIESNAQVLLYQGHSEIPESESEEWVSVESALEAVNAFNIGKFHPDVFIDTPYHDQVVNTQSVIIGFVLNDKYYESLSGAGLCDQHVTEYECSNIPF